MRSDNCSVEVLPFQPDVRSSLQVACLGLLGIPLGEFWDLEALAEACARRRLRVPSHLAGGTASPPNALAIK